MVVAKSDFATPIDTMRLMIASSGKFQAWVSATQTINGDSNSILSSLALTGISPDNTDRGVLYWNLTNAANVNTVDLYDAAAKASGNKVATGSRSGDGLITLAAANNSGLTGTIVVSNPAAESDTDSGNTIDTKLKVALARTYVDQVRAAAEGSLPTRPLAVITDSEYNRERRSLSDFGAFSEDGVLLVMMEAEVASGDIADDDGADAGYDFRNNLGDVVKDLEADQTYAARLNITSIGYEQAPLRNSAEEAVAHSDTFSAVLSVNWLRP